MKRTLILTLLVTFMVTCAMGADWEKKRAAMAQTIKEKGVKDEKVLQAMGQVKRHLFVPKMYRSMAYNDHPLFIGHDQTISQPYIVAFTTEALKLKGGETVLEIGTGSGYQAAVLAKLVKQVYSIEIICDLANSARARLKELNYKNIEVMCGDGYKGWPKHAPFDAIIITAAPDHIPQPLIDQLKVGGRMILPVGKKSHQELLLVTKTKSGIKKQSLLPVRFVPMTGPEMEKKAK